MNTHTATLGLILGALLTTASPGLTGDGAFAADKPVAARNSLNTGTVAYKDGDVALKGYLAFDPSVEGKRPGVLVIHEWWGLNEYPRRRARELAQLGYMAFAADMYGKGQVADNADAAAALAGPFRTDRELMRRRIAAALAILKADPRVDPDRVAAIGYCFGGTCVLELARSGADLAGVVSFHGGLDTPRPEKTPKPRAAILVCHGAADPHVSPQSFETFRHEMNRCGADWQLTLYGGAVHSFSNPESGSDPSKGVAYHATADKRSWDDMARFLRRVLAEPR
jgi:dienelactone hydrolase